VAPESDSPDVSSRTLLLAPSKGCGGGIERYVKTLEWTFTHQGIAYRRIDLHRSGAHGHARLLAEAAKYLRADARPTRIVLAHRALLPVAMLLRQLYDVSGISVICHGTDVWGPRLRPRWMAERQLMRSSDVRLVAVSSYTSGVLSSVHPATILPPGLSREWVDTLVAATYSAKVRGSGARLMTAFRLADWCHKGLPELLAAIAELDASDVHLTICGSGEPAPELLRLVRKYANCALMPNLDDQELARQFASADLFVLATRTRHGGKPSGEGFGLVLLEAQVAGTPVVAPAYGGSSDAYIRGITGDAPTDETVAALTRVLNRLLRDPDHLARMSKHAAEWARECLAPDKYAALAVDRLL
jgi:phosphatidylinositol alpha-1,6-mannosyltransferase